MLLQTYGYALVRSPPIFDQEAIRARIIACNRMDEVSLRHVGSALDVENFVRDNQVRLITTR